MISKVGSNYQLTVAEWQHLRSFQPYQPGTWDESSLEAIKTNIKGQLLKIQNNKCCYCGLKVNETGRAEIEHIAPKGGPKRPQHFYFAFTRSNLAIACEYCNSSSKKGVYDTIVDLDLRDYAKCTFKIVHPYFDEPSNHYIWSVVGLQVIIRARTLRGLNSIRLFEMDQIEQTEARAKQKIYENMQDMGATALAELIMSWRPK